MERSDGAQLQAQTGPQLELDQKGLTRRQFLSYVLGGTGAFMGTMIAAPLVGMALDPLNRSGGEVYYKTNWKPSDFNDQLPTPASFTYHIDDGWNSHNASNDVFVIKHDSKLMIMSHVCTHLGCHVDGSLKGGKPVSAEYGNGKYWFQCPCHGSQYNEYGVPSPSSPAPRPLNLFKYKIVDGYVHVGSDFTRANSSWDQNPNPSV